MKDIFYAINRIDERGTHSSRGYVHLMVSVLKKRYSGPDNLHGLDLKRIVTMRWQSHQENEASGWYGFNWQVDDSGQLEDLQAATSMAAKIVKAAASTGYGLEVKDLVTTMQDRLKVDRVVWDGRAGKYVRPRHALPAEYQLWCMDWQRVGWNSNEGVNVMARNDEEARKDILDEMMKPCNWASAETRLATLETWRKAGSPVKIISMHRAAPDTGLGLLKSPKQEQEERAAQVAEEVTA